MKIEITIDVSQHELPLATELISTLRCVRLDTAVVALCVCCAMRRSRRPRAGARLEHSTASFCHCLLTPPCFTAILLCDATQAADRARACATDTERESRGTGGACVFCRFTWRVSRDCLVLGPGAHTSCTSQATQAAALQAPATPAVASNGNVDEQVMRSLGLVSVNFTVHEEGTADATRCAQAAADNIVRLLGPEATTPSAAMSRLVRCVTMIMRDPDFGQRLEAGTVSVAPFAMLATHLPDSLRGEYIKVLKEAVAKELAEPRPKGTPRIKVFALAELFARIVSMGSMPIDAAVNIITRMVKATDKRVAGMTMLGKTVELCFELLSDSCSKQVMIGLRDELLALNDPEFSYDVEYTFECIGAFMDWTKATPVPAPKAAPAPAKPAPAAADWKKEKAAPVHNGGGTLVAASPLAAPEPVHSHLARPGSIFAMAVDTSRQAVVVAVSPSSGPEVGQVFDPVRGFRGEFAMAAPELMTNSLDIIPPGVMLASMVPKGSSVKAECCVRLFTFNNASETDRNAAQWQPIGLLSRPEARPLASTRWLPPLGNAYAFVQGEAHYDTEGGRRPAVVVFEIQPGDNFGSLKPVQQFWGHTQLISAVEPYPDDPNLVLSAAKDSTIRLWDRRLAQNGCAGMLVFANAATKTAHDQMIVSLAARGPTLLSASVDSTATQWDLRVLGRGDGQTTPHVAVWRAPDNGQFLRACLAPHDSMAGALSTHLGSVYTMDVHAAAVAASTGASPPALRQAAPHVGARTAQGRYHTLAWEAASGLLVGGWSGAVAPGVEVPAARIDVWRT